MSEIVERVALAISGSDDPKNILTIHRDRARLVFAALRVPTAAMLEQGPGSPYMDADVWAKMIDAA